jgi:thiol-activated cytolysin
MKKIKLQTIAGLVMAAVAGSAFANEVDNTTYINGLNYNRDLLLAVSLAPTSQPAAPGKLKRSSAVVICTNTPQSATNNPTENILLDPSGGVIFPGAIVRMDQQLARGTPTPYTLPRAPLTIRLDFPNCPNCTQTINNPTNVSVPNAVETIVRGFGALPNTGVAARAFYNSTVSYSKSQVAVDLGFSAQWESNSASASSTVSSVTEQTAVIKAFKQVYYTALAEAPVTSGSVFANSVKLNSSLMPVDGPPGFVSSVDYGRIIIVQMLSNDALLSADAKAAMDYVTGGGVKLSGSAKVKVENIVKNSEFRVLALGGNAGDTAELFRGAGDAVVNVIAKGLPYSANTPAFPIAYKVQDLKTRQLASMRLTTNYVKSECQEFPNAYVDLQLNAGYVAKFSVTWNETNANGTGSVAKSWNSGDKTSPWKDRVWLPGDASSISITGGGYTGLAWDKFRTTLNERPSAVTNSCWKLTGTTLNQKASSC